MTAAEAEAFIAAAHARLDVARYFGFLGNCHRARKLERCRELLGMAPVEPAADPPADYQACFQPVSP